MSTEQNTIKKLKHELKEKDKEISRLKKELRRRDDISEEYKELLEEQEEKFILPQPQGILCPKCQASVSTSTIGKFTLHRCHMCNWRQRK